MKELNFIESQHNLHENSSIKCPINNLTEHTSSKIQQFTNTSNHSNSISTFVTNSSINHNGSNNLNTNSSSQTIQDNEVEIKPNNYNENDNPKNHINDYSNSDQIHIVNSHEKNKDVYLELGNSSLNLSISATCESKVDETHAMSMSMSMSMSISQCSICLETLNSNIHIIKSCQHSFHSKCIKKWLLKHEMCPICRHKVVKKNYKQIVGWFINNQFEIKVALIIILIIVLLVFGIMIILFYYYRFVK